MAKAMESLAQLPIKMLTIHATAGPEALRKCVLTIKEDILPEAQLLSVTVLTSMNQDNLNSIGIQNLVPDQVDRLAKLSIDSGVTGIVSSP